MTGRRYDTISFLSDFGHADEFVGVVHSVIRSIAPQAGIIDVAHGIRRYDTRAGGLALARAANYLCPGVVVAVVDPGVGTARRPVALEVGDGMSVLIGPDNGLLAPAVGLVGGATRAFELTNPDFQLAAGGGATFDGRDVFAPAAAHLCNGVPITDIGTEIDPATLMPGVLPISRFEDGASGPELVCEVLWIDHFGNCQLNVDPLEIIDLAGPGGEVIVEIGAGSATPDERVGVRADAYDDIPTGRIGLVVDSSGLLSLAVARGSAAEDLRLGEGIEIRIRSLSEGDRGPNVSTPVQLGRRPNPTGGQ
ncbi:MAG: SAM-dependent chlorinase/fluorinase [Actinomycetota bacterium]